MIDTGPPTDSPKQPSSESVDSGAQEHILPDAADTDGQKSENQDGSEFESALRFHSWDGERVSYEYPEYPPTDGKAAMPEPPEANPASGQENEEKTEQADTDGNKKPMSLMGHLSELRTRLTRILIVIVLGFFACYGVSDILFGELIKPLTASMPQGSTLIFTSLPEAFFVYLKVAFVASMFLTSPYTFYQIWAFIAPGLYAEERRLIVPLAAFSALFFLAGAAFCYFLVFPIVFDFFMSFATDNILPMPSLDAYLSLTLKLLIAFGLIFEMPLFAFFLARIGILTAEPLRRWRKYAILASVIVGALLTPPDVPSQLIMAAAILVLYEISIWIVALVQKRPKTDDAAEDANKPAREAS